MGPTKFSLLLSTLLVASSIAAPCRADCFDAAAKYQHLNPIVLRGIATVESQNNPHAIRRDKNHTTDLGMMQVNTVHMPELNKHGVHKRDLMDECKNIYVGAWLLKREINKFGYTWKAVGGYHSETPDLRDEYALKVKKVVMQLASVSLLRSRHA
jgi:soluble lytic murein transglycosylase-like protein